MCTRVSHPPGVAWRGVAGVYQTHFVSASLVIRSVQASPRGVHTAEHARSGLRVQDDIMGHHLQDSRREKGFQVQCQGKQVRVLVRVRVAVYGQTGVLQIACDRFVSAPRLTIHDLPRVPRPDFIDQGRTPTRL
jgi:hypothetical protein